MQQKMEWWNVAPGWVMAILGLLAAVWGGIMALVRVDRVVQMIERVNKLVEQLVKEQSEHRKETKQNSIDIAHIKGRLGSEK